MKESNCTLIEIEQEIPGFNHFIGSWVFMGDVNLVVDVGPANSVGKLIETLGRMDMEGVDYVLLTHVHIDHVGGLSEILGQFPTAKVICHDKGIRHLVDPSQLWSGSLRALGGIAEAYGPPKAVKEDRFIPHTQAEIEDLGIIETPGHAAHHLSFSYGGNLFAGEAGGNYCSVQDMDYLRPATPPRFFLGIFLQSVDRLAALENQHICYAHFGDAANSRQMLKRFRAQVLRWEEIVWEEMCAGSNNLVTRCVDGLMGKDPDLKAFELLDSDTQKRERYFMTNSVKGYIGFLRERGRSVRQHEESSK